MRFAKNALLISLMAVLLVLSGCSSNNNLKNTANDMTEKMLVGINEDNYEKFSEDFDPKMKSSLSEEQFHTKNDEIKIKIGDYISKAYVSSEKKDGHDVVLFLAKFSEEKDDVIIRTILTENNGKYLVSGFWIDSPKLRKE